MIGPQENASLEIYYKEVAIYEALCRLQDNPDFKLVIMDTYLKDKALFLTSLLGRADVKKRGERPDAIEELVSISNLNEFFHVVTQRGINAKAELDGEFDEEIVDE